MKKPAIISGMVLATAVLMTALALAKNRTTAIHFTKNLNQGASTGQYPAECVGIVSTETLPSRRRDKVSWKVKNGNGQNSEDVCVGLDKSQVELHFQDDVMGAAAMKVLKSNAAGNIAGQISSSSAEASPPPAVHKYQVFYKNLVAGPDPEIIVDCGGCGPESAPK